MTKLLSPVVTDADGAAGGIRIDDVVSKLLVEVSEDEEILEDEPEAPIGAFRVELVISKTVAVVVSMVEV